MKRKTQTITKTAAKTIAMLIISTVLFTSCTVVEDIINLQAGMTRPSEYEQRYDVAEDVFMWLDETLLSTPLPDNLHFTLRNNSEQTYGYSLRMSLEKKLHGIWRAVLPYQNYEVPDIVIFIEPFSSETHSFPLFFYHNNLRPGQYRIVQRVQEWQEINEIDELFERQNTYIVFAEFTII